MNGKKLLRAVKEALVTKEYRLLITSGLSNGKTRTTSSMHYSLDEVLDEAEVLIEHESNDERVVWNTISLEFEDEDGDWVEWYSEDGKSIEELLDDRLYTVDAVDEAIAKPEVDLPEGISAPEALDAEPEMSIEEVKRLQKPYVIENIRDYLYYGNSFREFIDNKHPSSEAFSEEELKALWIKTRNQMGSED